MDRVINYYGSKVIAAEAQGPSPFLIAAKHAEMAGQAKLLAKIQKNL